MTTPDNQPKSPRNHQTRPATAAHPYQRIPNGCMAILAIGAEASLRAAARTAWIRLIPSLPERGRGAALRDGVTVQVRASGAWPFDAKKKGAGSFRHTISIRRRCRRQRAGLLATAPFTQIDILHEPLTMRPTPCHCAGHLKPNETLSIPDLATLAGAIRMP